MTTPQPVQPDPQEHDETHAVTRTNVGQETRSQDGTVSGLGSLSASSLQVGSTLGPYRLIAKLGAGGMGMVFRAEHTHLGKEVALKVLPAGMTQNPVAVSRFKREMKAVGKITHQHIVQAFDAGEVGGVHYLAMECIEGTDLQKLVQERGPLSPSNAAKAIRQAALGLSAAHALKLYHRDIKPSNILVTKGGQIKLLDLGLARLAEEAAEATELTVEGAAMGTPDFMAPEQWEDSHSADARSDLYALGCTLHFLLTGRAPYQTENSRTLVNKMKAHLATPAPDLRTAREGVPEPLAAIYEKLMAKDPAARYQTATELAEALRPLASTKGAPSVPAKGGTSSFLSVAGDETMPPVRSRRRGLIGAAAGAFAVVLLLGVIVITIRNRDGSETRIEVPDTSTVTVTPPGKNALPAPAMPAVPAAATSIGSTPPVASLSKPSPQRPADREIAVWALARGGQLLIEPGWREIHTSEDLPTGEFHLRHVAFNPEQAPLTVTDVELIARATHLRTLSSPMPRNFEEVLPGLARIPRLQSLNVGHLDRIPPSWSILGRNESLVELSIGVLDPAAGWSWLDDLPSLRGLNLWEADTQSLNGFGRHKSLRLVVFHGKAPEESLVRQIQQENPQLRIVAVSAEGIRLLGQDPLRSPVARLLERGIQVRGALYSQGGETPLTNDLLKTDAAWQIRSVGCEKATQITAEDAAIIREISDQEYLNVSFFGQQAADAVARELGGVARMWNVDLKDSSLTDAGLEALERLIDIRHLYLTGTRVTPAGVARFRSIHPTCHIISDAGELQPDFSMPLRSPAEVARASAGIRATSTSDSERDLAQMVLNLQGRLVIEPGFRNVNSNEDLPSSPFVVYSVELPPGRPPLAPESMGSLAAAGHLKGLSVPSNNDADRYIDALAAMPVMQVLSIGNAGTTTDYLATLRRSGGLSRMTTGLGATEISWKFVKEITSLRSLDVWTSDPPGFADLGSVPHLRMLRIYDSSSGGQPFDLDPAVIESLQASNPDLRIVVGPSGQPRVAGRDPVLPLAERLLARGVRLNGEDLQRSPGQTLTTESLKSMKVPIIHMFRHDGEPPLSAEDRGLLEKVTFGDHSSVIFSRQTDSDELARSIARCGRLVSVSLTDCDLTDTGLLNLASAVDIRSLDLTRTKVTEEGLKRFHRFHPTCEIVSDVLRIARDYAAPLSSPAEIRRELGVSLR